MFLASQDPASIYDLISKGGVPTILLIIIYTGYKKVWVWGSQLEEANTDKERIRGEKNEWREIAMLSTNLAESLDKVRKENK